MTNRNSSDWTGRTIGSDRFRVLEKIGGGGNGTVYRAVDQQQQVVAIKVPDPKSMPDSETADRFLQKARTLAEIDHPHIVRILAVDMEEGLPFVVTPFLNRGSLQTRWAAKGDARPLSSPRETGILLKSIGSALDFLHSRGFLHGKVNPANVLFDDRGCVFLGDLEDVKALPERGGSEAPSQAADMAWNLPQYMAPELFMPELSEHGYDARVDQYALGVMLFRSITGRPPYQEPTVADIAVAMFQGPPPLMTQLIPNLNRDIETAVFKALQEHPNDRYASCGEFVNAVTAQHQHAKTDRQKRKAGKTQQNTASPASPALSAAHEPIELPQKAKQVKRSQKIAKTKKTPKPAPASAPRASAVASNPTDPQKPGRRMKLAAAGGGVGLCALLILLAMQGGNPDDESDGPLPRFSQVPPAGGSSAPNGIEPAPEPDPNSLAAIPEPETAFRFPEWPQRTAAVGETLNLTLLVADAGEFIGNTTYRLDQSSPDGIQLDAVTGQLTWTPTLEHGGQTYALLVNAVHDESKLVTQRTLVIHVREPSLVVSPVPPIENPSITDIAPAVAMKPEAPKAPQVTRTPLAALPADSRTEKYREHVASIFENGQKGFAGLDDAARSFAAAQSLAPDDPRAYYAYGLALRQGTRLTDAAKQFDAAANAGGKPRPLGWHARILVLLQKEDHEEALNELQALAEKLQSSAPGGDSPEWTPQTAGFIGRAVGYLELGCDQTKTNQLAEASHPAIQSQLPADCLAAFQAEFQLASQLAEWHRHKESELTKEDRQQQFQDFQSEKANELPQLQKQAADQDKKIQDLTANYKQTLAAADKEITLLETTGAAGEIKLNQLLVTYQQRETNFVNVLQQIDLGLAGNNSRVQAEKERDRAKASYQQGKSFMDQLKQKYLLQKAQRVNLTKAYFSVKEKQQPILDRLNKKIQQSEAKLAKFEYRPSRRAQSEIRDLTLWSTFLDWDYETERKRILASLE